MATTYRHIPVLLDEVIAGLDPQDGDNIIDGTIGGGGHAHALLAKSSPTGRLLGLDLDPRALAASRKKLKDFGSRAVVVKASYADLTSVLREHPDFKPVNSILVDLGLSSDQLDASGRGFSFHDTDTVDMRFDPDASESASDLLFRSTEEELAEILKAYGEIPN